MFHDATDGLRTLLNIPANFQILFVSSALESMERVIQGCCGQNSFHIITGSFGKAWAKYAGQLGKSVTTYTFENTEQGKLSDLKIPKKAEIICITQNDTSTGFWFPVEEIIKLKKKYPEKLIAIDVVSSVPYVDLDFGYIDLAFFSVQKGFGLPAGLGVIIAGPKALQKTESICSKTITGSYHSFKNLWEKAGKFQTPETPNVLNIYLLNSVIKDMLRTGIQKIRKDTDKKAQTLYQFFEKHKEFQPFITSPKFRSPTTLVFDVKGKSDEIRKKLAKKGYLVGAGYGDNKLNHIRIANFPTHKLKDIKSILKHF